MTLWKCLPFASHLDLGHGINLKVLPSGGFKISFTDDAKLVFELLTRSVCIPDGRQAGRLVGTVYSSWAFRQLDENRVGQGPEYVFIFFSGVE